MAQNVESSVSLKLTPSNDNPIDLGRGKPDISSFTEPQSISDWYFPLENLVSSKSETENPAFDQEKLDNVIQTQNNEILVTSESNLEQSPKSFIHLKWNFESISLDFDSLGHFSLSHPILLPANIYLHKEFYSELIRESQLTPPKNNNVTKSPNSKKILASQKLNSLEFETETEANDITNEIPGFIQIFINVFHSSIYFHPEIWFMIKYKDQRITLQDTNLKPRCLLEMNYHPIDQYPWYQIHTCKAQSAKKTLKHMLSENPIAYRNLNNWLALFFEDLFNV